MNKTPKYRGDGKPPDSLKPNCHNQPEPYIHSAHLTEAVNTAIFLRRPLLLEGEPGCGKTRLAYAVAYELGFPLKTCYVRSSSKADDFLYVFDALHRLFDLEVYRICHDGAMKPPDDYVRLRALGEAVELSIKGEPSIVLIDEIDKADFDFPNDLLTLLDEWKFKVKETDKDYDALQGKTVDECKDALPIVIITSNKERELPSAFLRRCLYFCIPFPSENELNAIVQRHFPQPYDKALDEAALMKFLELRDKLPQWRKKPSVSELIDWFKLLIRQDSPISAKKLRATPISQLPYLETLIKTQSDLEAIKRAG
jgi:MoxR-like ATPase